MPIDYTRYPSEWKTHIVPAIKERAKECCEFCSVKNKQELFSVEIVFSCNGKSKKRKVWITDVSDVARLSLFCSDVATAKKKVTVHCGVAHLDHDEENHTVTHDRLAYLCQYCHLNYDIEEKMRRKAE